MKSYAKNSLLYSILLYSILFYSILLIFNTQNIFAGEKEENSPFVTEISENYVFLPVLSPDGSHFATIEGGEIVIRDAQSFEIVKKITPYFSKEREIKNPALKSVEFSPNGKFILAVSTDYCVSVYNVESGKVEYVIDDSSCFAETATFGKDEFSVILPFDGKNLNDYLRLIGIDSFIMKRKVGFSSKVVYLSKNSSSDTFLVSTADGKATLIFAFDGEMEKLGEYSWDKTSGIFPKLSADGNAFILPKSANEITVISLDFNSDGPLFSTIVNQSGFCSDASFSSDGKIVVAGNRDGEIKVYDWKEIGKKSAKVENNAPNAEVDLNSDSGTEITENSEAAAESETAQKTDGEARDGPENEKSEPLVSSDAVKTLKCPDSEYLLRSIFSADSSSVLFSTRTGNFYNWSLNEVSQSSKSAEVTENEKSEVSVEVSADTKSTENAEITEGESPEGEKSGADDKSSETEKSPESAESSVTSESSESAESSEDGAQSQKILLYWNPKTWTFDENGVPGDGFSSVTEDSERNGGFSFDFKRRKGTYLDFQATFGTAPEFYKFGGGVGFAVTTFDLIKPFFTGLRFNQFVDFPKSDFPYKYTLNDETLANPLLCTSELTVPFGIFIYPFEKNDFGLSAEIFAGASLNFLWNQKFAEYFVRSDFFFGFTGGCRLAVYYKNFYLTGTVGWSSVTGLSVYGGAGFTFRLGGKNDGK